MKGENLHVGWEEQTQETTKQLSERQERLQMPGHGGCQKEELLQRVKWYKTAKADQNSEKASEFSYPGVLFRAAVLTPGKRVDCKGLRVNE